ncbi:MAG: hypothetical protein OHK0023_22330 [Anaerolineae bacterium]
MRNSSAYSNSSNEAKIIPLDPDHIGIRVALPLIAVAAFVAFAVLLPYVISSADAGCLSLILATFGALITMALADFILKRVWKSGRQLELLPTGLRLYDKRKSQAVDTRIMWDGRVNVLAWRFTVKRGSARVSKGWIMLGCQLTQDEAQMTLYTFMPPKDANSDAYSGFVQLMIRDVVAKGNLPLRELNTQRQLLQAENERWQGGAEMSREDFAALITALSAHQPNWAEGGRS